MSANRSLLSYFGKPSAENKPESSVEVQESSSEVQDNQRKEAEVPSGKKE